MKRLLIAVPALLLGANVQAQQVFSTDLIVQGSECVGFDCSTSESFGFDTIRLKENNLRIKFEDTSTAASFPTNDWQLTANDSANGGLSKFSIDDISGGRTPFTIEAGAPSHSLYVEDSGEVGFGTNTPVVELHTTAGDTPTLRLQQDTSSGFAAQTWDIAGNETSFFVRDATNGSTLPFRIRPGSPSNAIVIDPNGDVGLGTLNPNGDLAIERNGTAQLALVNNSSGSDWRFQNFNDTFRVTLAGTGSGEMTLDGSGNVTFLGTVAANGGSDTLPDYVFEEDYQLMKLDELRAFVRSNKHLPNIPSKGDIARQGGVVDMTKMQYKLLEKIEELTLYTLEQQEEIEQLKKRLTAKESVASM